MKKILVLMIVISLFIINGCSENKFTISNTIHPTILNIFGADIAIEYTLGDILVLDELTALNRAQAMYISKHQDNIGLQLIIKSRDGLFPLTVFKYYLEGGNELGTNNNVIEADIIIANSHNIDNFVWITKDGKDIIDQTKAPTTITDNQTTEGKI